MKLSVSDDKAAFQVDFDAEWDHVYLDSLQNEEGIPSKETFSFLNITGFQDIYGKSINEIIKEKVVNLANIISNEFRSSLKNIEHQADASIRITQQVLLKSR